MVPWCRLCHEMKERELITSVSHASMEAGFAGPSSASFPGGAVGSDYRKHLDEFGKRKTIKPDSYFSDEDASD